MTKKQITMGILEALHAGFRTVDDITGVTDMSRTEVIASMRRMARRGQGAFVVGRKGHPSRFEPFKDAVQHKTDRPAQVSQKDVEAAVTTIQKYLAALDTNVFKG